MQENLAQNRIPRARQSTKLRTLNLQSYPNIHTSDGGEEYSDPDISASESDDQPTQEVTENFIYRKCLRNEKSIPRSTKLMLDVQDASVSELRQRSIRRIAKFHYYFRMSSEAFFNAVMYFDIFISKCPLNVEDLELVVVSCYVLAVKFDCRTQIQPEQINKLLQTSYTKKDFALMEMKIVTALDFNMSFPTAHMFMNRFLATAKATPQIKEIASVLIEIAVMLFKFVDVPPSVIAASAVAVACSVIRDQESARAVVADLAPVGEDMEVLKKTITEFIGYSKDIVSSRAKIGDDNPVQKLISAMNFSFTVEDIL